jgi:putative lipoprotein
MRTTAAFVVVWLMNSTAAATSQESALAGSEWRPVRIGNAAVPQSAEIYVQFRSQGKLSGRSGCNRLSGSYRVAADSIRIGPLASTRMACAPEIMKLEAAFLAALESAATFRRDGARLALRDRNGTEVSQLQQTDWD